ncbi:4Fe-4S dicluster domain-containing protein [candidate division KSB1 bacterium]|nr:4Fe-4S dicluster domain-containing protein [candidate division KSB1 bacterium]MBL7092584.1 4Fe-4S dicluster domain-containing protein [candidate division KSB1 bacterium]
MKIKLQLQNLILRPWRLTILLIIFALAFVYGRLILFSVLGIVLFISAIKVLFVEKKSYFGIIIPLIVLLLISGVYFIIDYNRVSSYILDHSPLDLELVLDGTYEGTGQGLRGPIKVKVEIEDHKILNIKVLQHQEMITALDDLEEQIIVQNSLAADLIPSTTHGSIEATSGFLEAVSYALWEGVPEKPEYSSFTKVMHYFSKFKLDLPTFNALAILFCIVLVFDYTMQPVLVKGTGQALNCYNCQTCVGVCPIKIVDGEPYPMTMILAARLGDYEKVKYLSKFCVACSRCAGKCPVGDSGPSIAAQANAYFKKEKQRKKDLADV